MNSGLKKLSGIVGTGQRCGVAFAVASPDYEIVKSVIRDQVGRVQSSDRRRFLFRRHRPDFLQLAFHDNLAADLPFLNFADRFFNDLFVLHHNRLLDIPGHDDQRFLFIKVHQLGIGKKLIKDQIVQFFLLFPLFQDQRQGSFPDIG